MSRRSLLLALLLPAALAAQQPPAPAQEDSLRRADELAAAGKNAEAVPLYRAWLAANLDSGSFGAVLLQAASAAPEASLALALLGEFAPRVADPGQRAEALGRQLGLLRLMGRFEEALALERAQAPAAPGLYAQAVLLYEQGEREQAEKLLSALLQAGGQSLEPETAARSHYLLAVIYTETGRLAQAEACFRLLDERYAASSISPAVLLARRELERRRNNPAGAEEAAKELCRRFPASPECALASGTEGRVRLSPTPARLLPALEQQPVPAPGPQETVSSPGTLVQIGSFRDEENARCLVRDLKAKGFQARVVEALIREVRYYRVVAGSVQSPEQAQDMLVRLKEAGFEGVLLLPD